VYSAPPAAARSAEPSTAASERQTPPAPTRGTQAEASTAFGSSAATPQNEPAEEPGAAAEPTLPSAAALAAQGVALPALRLELHAYSPNPADRFVFINGTKYVEGAMLAEGPRVVSIAPNGAVLVYVGRRFLLTPQ
jgi:general secretion pathway protein B